MLPVCNTLQVKDYGRYAMGGFDAAAKQRHHDEHFPVDLQAAFDLGERLGT